MPRLRVAASWLAAATLAAAAVAQQRPNPLAEPFTGVTAAGTVATGLFAVRSTGVGTGPVRDAALRFTESLTAEQRAKTTYPVDDSEWRNWNNIHRATRQGVAFKEMSEAQQARAFALLEAGLSTKGLGKARNITYSGITGGSTGGGGEPTRPLFAPGFKIKVAA